MNLKSLGNLLFHTHGRINRKTWWLTQIGVWLAASITTWVWHKYGLHDAIFGLIGTLFIFWIRISVNIKRWHDRGRSAWMVLILELPTVCSFVGFFINIFIGFAALAVAGIVWVWGFIELGFLPSKPDDKNNE